MKRRDLLMTKGGFVKNIRWLVLAGMAFFLGGLGLKSLADNITTEIYFFDRFEEDLLYCQNSLDYDPISETPHS